MIRSKDIKSHIEFIQWLLDKKAYESVKRQLEQLKKEV